MWREEVGITEMMLAYIGEFVEFNGWSSWRNVVIDILSCHEDVRRQRNSEMQSFVMDIQLEGSPVKEIGKEEADFREISVPVIKDTDEKIVKASTSTEESDQKIAKKHIKDTSKSDLEYGEIVLDSDTEDIKKDIVDTNDDDPNYQGLEMDEECMNVQMSDACGMSSKNPFSTVVKKHRFMGPCPDGAIESGAPYRYVTCAADHTMVRKYYTCNVCGKQFDQLSQKLRHDRIHSGDKPFKCSFCSKSFSQKGNMRFHERIHLGERPYTCSYCGKSFIQKGHKDRHELIHFNRRPYTCPFCGKSFARKHDKERHERIHTRMAPPYQ